MEAKGKERGILKLDPRPRVLEQRAELTPQFQGSYDRGPSSPQPSVDRLSVTWADPGSMTSSGVNLFHLPTETPINNEVKFSPTAGDGSEDEDYSVSLSAVLRQRRASVRRSRKGRGRRPSSPFPPEEKGRTRRPSSPYPDDSRARRRSSQFTTSSGDTAISMDDGQPAVATQEQIFENIHLHKEVLGSVKQQPLGMSRKLKLVHQAKAYIKRHEGQLQERLAQSKSTRDIYARFIIVITTKWQQLKREAANTSNLLIPWELRIKEIESHFGSVVASYFTFLRWLFWVNLVIASILLMFVIVPEYLTANPFQDGERKIIMEDERQNASNLLTLWEFEGILKYSSIFYGYYSNLDRPQYRMPLAYFLTGLVVYIYSFVAILGKMAENSRMSKLSEKEDECIFSWKLFTGWDFMIGNAETAHNRIASVILGFKEALLEEAEKKKDLRNWRIISLRTLVNVCVFILLGVSAYAVVTVVSRSDDDTKARGWWRENETTIVVTGISILFPVFFELLGLLEHYHPRKQLRLQLARIMLLNLLNLYSLIIALFSKIEGMSRELDTLKPTLSMNATLLSDNSLNATDAFAMNLPMTCFEVNVSCAPCNIQLALPADVISSTSITPSNYTILIVNNTKINNTTSSILDNSQNIRNTTTNTTNINPSKQLLPQNLIENGGIDESYSTTEDTITLMRREMERINKLYLQNINLADDSSSESDEDYSFEYTATSTSPAIDTTDTIDIILDTGYHTSDDISSSEEGGWTTMFDPLILDYDGTQTTESSTSDVYTASTLDPQKETETFSTGNEAQTDTTTDYSTEFTTNEIMFETDPVTKVELNSYLPPTGKVITTQKTVMLTETTTPYQSTVSKTESVTPKTFPKSVLTSVLPNVPTMCPNYTFNCTTTCAGKNVTQVFYMANCIIVRKKCYTTVCTAKKRQTNATMEDYFYLDEHNKKMYNLTIATKKKLLKLCWETMFGQELVKLTMMDLVFVLLGTLFMDFFRALFVKYMNRCWCWDLEKKFPEYGDFKIAENILHLINNQGMVWMGMFFSPGLVLLNVCKLMIMMYLRSWAVMTCNVPHEVVFRVSKSNNFYLALLLTMLFLCVLPVGYAIVWVKPSWHCGPFSEYNKIYYILTNNLYKLLPRRANFALEYAASPAIVIPLLVLLILVIYYLISLTNSLREANNDLKIQLRRERTEERRKMFQLADTRLRAGSTEIDSTPFSRWKKALPSLPFSKSIDSEERKTIPGEDNVAPLKSVKKRGGIFAKIVGMALDKKTDVEAVLEVENNVSSFSNYADDETDTDFHETLPKEVLKIKDIVFKHSDKKKLVDCIKETNEELKQKIRDSLKVKLEKLDDRTEKRAIAEKQEKERIKEEIEHKHEDVQLKESHDDKKIPISQTSQSSTQSRQSDSIGSVIPVITISTTESDDEILHPKKVKLVKEDKTIESEKTKDSGKPAETKLKSTDVKSLRRQSSVDSTNEHNITTKHKKSEDGHKYQYSL